MTTWNKTNNRFSKFSDSYGSAKSSVKTLKGLVSGSKKKTSASSAAGPTGPAQTSSKTDEEKKLTTSNNAIYQDFKLYIEGEECQFESASISFGVSSIPAMTLQFVPYKILRNLEERTKVHLYFIDPVDGKERLLFDGEISGVGYTKNPSAQTLTYSVTHVSSYLDEILVSFFDKSAYGHSFPPLWTTSLGSKLKTEYSIYSYTTLEKILSPDSIKSAETFQQIFVELFGKIFEAKSGKKLNPTLSYFKKRVDEWALDKRMATLPVAGSDKVDTAFTFKDFIKSENAISIFLEKVKQIDGWQSLFAVLGEMFRTILYYPIILPSPYLYTPAITESPNAPSRSAFGELGDMAPDGSELSQLQSILYKPQALFVLPPICNVVWPSMYTVFSFSRNFKSMPTRLFVRTGIERIAQSNDGSLEFVAQYFWAPKKLQDELTGKVQPTEDSTYIYDRLVGGTSVFSFLNPIKEEHAKLKTILGTLSELEEKVGVRITTPADSEFFSNYARWLITRSSGQIKDEKYPYLGGLDTANRRIQELVDYELARKQFETEVVSMIMVFNPYIVPGFPTLIMDKPESGMHVYGYVSGINHTISAAAGCSTTMDIGYVHQYDKTISKRFAVAEDVWADEDAVYERLLGIKSIKGAKFNTIEDEKKKSDKVEIAKNIAENMSNDDFHDYIYNAYIRSGRSIVTKTEYDKFAKDIKYDEDVQKKVKKYRTWVEKRVAGSVDLGDVKEEKSATTALASSSIPSSPPGSVSSSSADAGTTVASKTAERKDAAKVWEDSGGGVSAEDKAKDAAFYESRERARNRPKFGL